MITTNRIPPAIIFFGPDGSGKTTQAELLIKELRRNGIRSRKLWLRSLHTFAFLISKVAMHTMGLQSVYDFRARYSHKKFFKGIWYTIEFCSILPLILFRLQLPLMKGYTIVAERYVIDWIVSLSYVSRNERLLDSSFGRAALKFIPKNSSLIYIDATYDAISSRGRNEDSLEYIEFQRRLYQEIARRLNAKVIDTSDKTLQEVHKLICQYSLNSNTSASQDIGLRRDLE
ncbi:MAG: thymidylate kinase [Candidatus Nitrosomirales archaeon]|jgi:thymidylate kinase